MRPIATTLLLLSATSLLAISYVPPKTMKPVFNCTKFNNKDFYFKGGAPIPPQLIGGYGPGYIIPWDSKAKKPKKGYGPVFFQAISGLPNGVTQIDWDTTHSTLECTLGWSCLNDNKSWLWHKGIVFNLIKGKDTIMCHLIKIANKHSLVIDNTQDKSSHAQTIEVYETAWPASDNKKKQCPDSLYQQVYEGKDNGLNVNYIFAKENHISGLHILPKKLWSCEAVKTSNFNDTEFTPILPGDPLNKSDLVN